MDGTLTSPLVLFVCTANVCRSPMAELLLRHRVAGMQDAWPVASAGVRAPVGRPLHPLADEALQRRGVPTERAGGAVALTPQLVERAGLVLVAEPAHRSAVVRMLPRAAARTFLLLQFAELLHAAPTADDPSLATLVRAANAARSTVPARPAADYAVADPIGGSAADFDVCAELLADAIEAVVAGSAVGGLDR